MSLEVGDVALGRFRVTRLLGQGGMGKVFLGEHVRLGTRVALKVLLMRDEPDVRARFVSEAELMARVHHPNAVSVLDFGETPDGSPILAMEFVDGESLGDVLEREGSIAWRTAGSMIERALAGLEAAHEIGVVHRDIKPPNILVTRAEPRTVKLADFGIAKAVVGPKRTATGLVIGTPTYMAPEVLAGKPATPASDVYSMATTLFELVTGRLPFDPEDPLARFEQDAPPVRAPPDRPGVPQRLDTLVRACLARSVARRVATADEFAEELRGVLAGRSGSAPGPPSDALVPTMKASAERRAPPDPDRETRREQAVAPTRPDPPPPPDPERAASAATLEVVAPSAPVTTMLVVAALPASRLALADERRTLATIVGVHGRSYSLGAGVWFATLTGTRAKDAAEMVRSELAKRYGSTLRCLLGEAPPEFKLSTTQLAGAAPLPDPLPDLISRVTLD